MALAVALGLAGCATSETRDAEESPPAAAAALYAENSDVTVNLFRVMAPGEPGALIQAPGWNEYRLRITNRSLHPLTIHDARLLTTEGRYIESAATYAEITAPPDPASEIAKDVARQSAGIAAGQLVPFGGTVVGLVTSAASSLSAQEEAKTRSAFALRRIKSVELAPGGRLEGSAFLPQLRNAAALVIDYTAGNRDSRIEVPFRETSSGASSE